MRRLPLLTGRAQAPAGNAADISLALVLLVADLLVFSDIITGDPTDRQRGLMLAFGLTGHALLIFRRRSARLVFGGVWAQVTIAAVLSWRGTFYLVPFFGPLVALHTLAVRVRPRVSAIALAAAMFPAIASVWIEVRSVDAEDRLSAFLGVSMFYLLFTGVSWASGCWVRASRAAEEQDKRQLAEAHEAINAERKRIARELHDIIASTVTRMQLQAAGARRIVAEDAQQAGDALRTIEELGKSAIQELHRMLSLIRRVPPSEAVEGLPADTFASGRTDTGRLLADLRDLVDSVNEAGVSVRLSADGPERQLDTSFALTTYRLVQEATTNIIKHAGPGSTAAVELTWHDDGLRVEITDDGGGLPPEGADELSTGHGLPGLRERVQVFGGTFEAGPHADGFRLTATIPLTLPDQDITPPQRSTRR